jgi:hypothetical protein
MGTGWTRRAASSSRYGGGADASGEETIGATHRSGMGTIGYLIFFSMSTSNRYHSAVVKDVVYPEVKG